MENNNVNDPASQTNTVLIVLVLVLLVGFGVWWMTTHKAATTPEEQGVNVNVTLPPSTKNDNTPPINTP